MQKNIVKHSEYKPPDVLDPSKMTITQKMEFQKVKSDNKRVSAILKKEYEEKLKGNFNNKTKE